MVGHSKWSQVKHIKEPLEARCGAAVSKRVKEITAAARLGGGDLSGYPRLRSDVETACAANQPKDHGERAGKTGGGELTGACAEKTLYEDAPGRIVLFIEAATDNRNRNAANQRITLSKHHGNFAASGSVSYPSREKGQTTIPRSLTDEDRPHNPALAARAGKSMIEDRFGVVADASAARGIATDSQQQIYLPDHPVAVRDEPTTAQVLHLDEVPDEDIQNATADSELPETLLARISA